MKGKEMETTCYCVFCPNHPLHNKRHELPYPTGWEPGKIIFGDVAKAGKAVSCLKPASNAYDEFGIDADEFTYPETAYGDGCSETGVIGDDFTIRATCSNEGYRE
jgi:hypothetical protein